VCRFLGPYLVEYNTFSCIADPDQSEKLDPDQDPHHSQKQDPDQDLNFCQNSGTVEVKTEPWRASNALNEDVPLDNS
jgi:hypothetical protein